MTEQENWKILQIIPAQPGWKAVHCEEAANGEMRISNRSIICWALVEPIDRSVVGGTEVRGVEQGAKDLAIVENLIKTNGQYRAESIFSWLRRPGGAQRIRVLGATRQSSGSQGKTVVWKNGKPARERDQILTRRETNSEREVALRLRQVSSPIRLAFYRVPARCRSAPRPHCDSHSSPPISHLSEVAWHGRECRDPAKRASW